MKSALALIARMYSVVSDAELTRTEAPEKSAGVRAKEEAVRAFTGANFEELDRLRKESPAVKFLQEAGDD